MNEMINEQCIPKVNPVVNPGVNQRFFGMVLA